MSSFSVMTYNILNDWMKDEYAWTNRREPLIATIKQANPDMFGLQEVLHHQLEDICSAMPEYDYIGVGRDDGKQGGEYACIFYRKERFEVISTGNFWLSETPDTPSYGWDAEYIRICTYGVFADKQTDKTFTYYNTHLEYSGRTAVLNGIKMIRERMLNDNSPSFVSGDMNFCENCEPYDEITKPGISDSRHAAKQRITDGGSMNCLGGISKEDILGATPGDLIFIEDSGFEVLDFQVIFNGMEQGKYVSDHFPVMITVELK